MTIDVTCPFCGFSRKIPEENVPINARRATCPRCRQRFVLSHAKPATGPEDENLPVLNPEKNRETKKAPPYGGSPWENRSEIGLWTAIFQTIRMVLFSPADFFRTISAKGSIQEPFAFGLLIGAIGGMFSWFWQLLMISGGLLTFVETFFGQFSFGIVFIVLIVGVPIMVIIGLFISSAVWYLFLFITRGANNGFEAIFRVVAYSQAAQLWGMIPFIGGVIVFFWTIITQIIGMKEIHRTSYTRVILAFLIPFALILFIIMGIFALVIYFAANQSLGSPWS